MNIPFSLPIAKTFTAALLALSLTATINTTHAAEIEMSFQNLLQQERSWAGLQTKTLKVGDITWSYSEGGQSGKPIIVLIHGLAGSRDNWNRVAHALTANYHVIIPDLPASGETQVPKDFDYSVPNVTEKLRRFIEAANLTGPAHLAGHSLGGSVAMLYAGQYPFETKSLFLVNAAGVYRSANTPYLKDPNQLRNMVVSKKGDFNFLMQQAMYAPPFIPKEIAQAQERMMIGQVEQTKRMVDQVIALNKLYTPDSFALLARAIDAPTLILWGKQDKIINVEVAPELKSLLKNAQAPVILENVGHMPILEADQLVVQQYLPFLSKIQAQKPATASTP
ncbi:alpha/beta fold hydrolase [Acinetobacter haemolyticus]|uniref:alpha/beta fold hydrolase n=1 Tax=Acinetobacter haemolyticus TaxID=29430 RepID=UPI000E14632B|nr:alpha/beta hydrolase [Acinetobacter haemolyticus]SUU23359.1 alpha/beta superfamily hydrolase/acyltransferase [Acinetobacter haemolyticus]